MNASIAAHFPLIYHGSCTKTLQWLINAEDVRNEPMIDNMVKLLECPTETIVPPRHCQGGRPGHNYRDPVNENE